MSISKKTKSSSMETFKKVLRFIGRYRFLLIASIVLCRSFRNPSALCSDSFRKRH